MLCRSETKIQENLTGRSSQITTYRAKLKSLCALILRERHLFPCHARNNLPTRCHGQVL